MATEQLKMARLLPRSTVLLLFCVMCSILHVSSQAITRTSPKLLSQLSGAPSCLAATSRPLSTEILSGLDPIVNDDVTQLGSLRDPIRSAIDVVPVQTPSTSIYGISKSGYFNTFSSEDTLYLFSYNYGTEPSPCCSGVQCSIPVNVGSVKALFLADSTQAPFADGTLVNVLTGTYNSGTGKIWIMLTHQNDNATIWEVDRCTGEVAFKGYASPKKSDCMTKMGTYGGVDSISSIVVNAAGKIFGAFGGVQSTEGNYFLAELGLSKNSGMTYEEEGSCQSVAFQDFVSNDLEYASSSVSLDIGIIAAQEVITYTFYEKIIALQSSVISASVDFQLTTSPVDLLNAKPTGMKIFFDEKPETCPIQINESAANSILYGVGTNHVCLGAPVIGSRTSSLFSASLPIYDTSLFGLIDLSEDFDDSQQITVIPLGGDGLKYLAISKQSSLGSEANNSEGLQPLKMAIITITDVVGGRIEQKGCCDVSPQCLLSFSSEVFTPSVETHTESFGSEMSNLISTTAQTQGVATRLSSSGTSEILFVLASQAGDRLMFQLDHCLRSMSPIAVIPETESCVENAALIDIAMVEDSMYMLIGNQDYIGISYSVIGQPNQTECLYWQYISESPLISSAMRSAVASSGSIDAYTNGGHRYLSVTYNGRSFLFNVSSATLVNVDQHLIMPAAILKLVGSASSFSLGGNVLHAQSFQKSACSLINAKEVGTALGGVFSAAAVVGAVVDTVVSAASSAGSGGGGGGGGPGKLKAALPEGYQSYTESFSWTNLYIQWPWLDQTASSNATLSQQSSSFEGFPGKESTARHIRRHLLQSLEDVAGANDFPPTTVLLAVLTTLILVVAILEILSIAALFIGRALGASSRKKIHLLGNKMSTMGLLYVKKVPLRLLLFAYYSIVTNSIDVLVANNISIGVQVLAGFLMTSWIAATCIIGVVTLQRHKDRLQEPTIIAQYGMYYKSYRIRSRHFFLSDLLYKLMESIFIASLPNGALQVGFLTVMEVTVVLLIGILRPFREKTDFLFNLAMGTSRALILLLTVPLLAEFDGTVSATTRDTIGYIMMVVQILVTVLGVCESIVSLRAKFIIILRKMRRSKMDRSRSGSLTPNAIRKTSVSAAQEMSKMGSTTPEPSASPVLPREYNSTSEESGPNLSEEEINVLLQGMKINPQFTGPKGEQKTVDLEQANFTTENDPFSPRKQTQRRDSGIPKAMKRNLRFAYDDNSGQTPSIDTVAVSEAARTEPEVQGSIASDGSNLRRGVSTFEEYSPPLYVLEPIEESEEAAE